MSRLSEITSLPISKPIEIVGVISRHMPGGGLSWMGTGVCHRALEAGVSEISNEHESYPGSGLSEEITPLVLLCGVSA